jgi:hypothetical protein
MLRLSKNSGASNNPVAQNLARQTQKLNQYITDKFSNYVINFTVKKIQYSILTSVVEIIPWIGDFSPSWTIKANLHLKEHRKTARELKIKTLEFEKSLAKWRGSLRIGGYRRFNSSNNTSAMNKVANNNTGQIRGERLAGERAEAVINQQDINLDLRETAANNIVPFRRKKMAGDIGQATQGQNNRLANVKSAVGNISSVGRQLAGSFPQSLEYEDEELQDKKLVSNNIRTINNRVFRDISKPTQPQNNIDSMNNTPVANNIKKFNRAQQNQADSEQILETLNKK